MRRQLLTLLAVVAALGAGVVLGRWQETSIAKPYSEGEAAKPEQEILDRFHEIWYLSPDTWLRSTWMGIQTMQNPMDVWVTQEIMFETRPEVVVEAGAYFGGSAALWATILEQVSPAGRVISIDIEDRMNLARALPIVQQRVDFLIGSSTSPEIVAEVTRRVGEREAMVLLDSLHTRDHVLSELRAYAPLVKPGGYLIVQDSNVNGHPVHSPYSKGPGPYEAIQDFLAEDGRFVVDRDRERLLFTFCPSGFLRRVR